MVVLGYFAKHAFGYKSTTTVITSASDGQTDMDAYARKKTVCEGFEKAKKQTLEIATFARCWQLREKTSLNCSQRGIFQVSGASNVTQKDRQAQKNYERFTFCHCRLRQMRNTTPRVIIPEKFPTRTVDEVPVRKGATTTTMVREVFSKETKPVQQVRKKSTRDHP